MRRDLDDGKVVVVAGFQGVDARGNITTLGRGGSDLTAVALAASLMRAAFVPVFSNAQRGSSACGRWCARAPQPL